MNDSTVRPVPYPADTRAKGWRFELDHERIRQSDTWALAPADLRPWLLMLWMTAWEQMPCGSLPAEDDLIAARIGISTKLFAKHRAVLLRGWWKAEDGRLYHNIIAQRVTEMLATKDKERTRKAAYRQRMDAERSRESRGVPGLSHGTDVGQTRDSHGSDPGRDATGTGTGTSNKPKDTVELTLDGGVPSDGPLSETEKIEGIFAYWQRVTGASKAKLGEKRIRTIRAALRWGYSPRDLCRAIQGCALTPHNQGINDRGQKYLGLHVCLGSEDQIDRFMANSKSPPQAPERRASNVVPGWWNSDELAKQQAALVGVGGPFASESRDAWHARIRAAIERGGKPASTAPAQSAAPMSDGSEPPRIELTPEQVAERRAALMGALKRGNGGDVEDMQ